MNLPSQHPIVATVLLLVATSSLSAQDLGVIGLYPPAAAPGETVEVTCRGKAATWPVTVWCDRPGIQAVAQETQGKIELEVSADAAPGLYWLRLHGPHHASKLLPFYVDRLPSALESEPNNRTSEATPITIPAAAMGRLEKADDVDTFRLELQEGERVTAAVLAHRPFGSPMDAVLQVCDSDGNVIDQNDDARGLDPQLTFQAPASGAYLLRLFAFPETPNSSVRFAGAETFIYRIEVSKGTRFESPLPTTAIEQVTESGPQRVAEAHEGRQSTIYFSPQAVGTIESSATLQSVSNEPAGQEADQSKPLRLPVDAWGLIEDVGGQDEYEIQLAKDQKVRVTVESRPYLLETDPFVRIKRQDGSRVAENDDFDNQRMARVDLTAPEEGIYRVEVSDATGQGGPRFGYRLRVEPISPSFELVLKAHSIAIAPGQSATIEVEVIRKDGFDGPIQVEAIDLPDGVTSDVVTSTKGEATEKRVTLTLKADTAFHGQPFRIVGGEAEEDASDARTVARFATGIGQSIHAAIWIISTTE